MSEKSKTMQHFKLVLPEHMNHQGSLFGGNLLSWIDEVAYMTAALHYPDHHFVTVALDNVEFRHRIDCGEIICFNVTLEREGNTSITYFVSVTDADEKTKESLFATRITFVSIDDEGNKKAIEKSS